MKRESHGEGGEIFRTVVLKQLSKNMGECYLKTNSLVIFVLSINRGSLGYSYSSYFPFQMESPKSLQLAND